MFHYHPAHKSSRERESASLLSRTEKKEEKETDPYACVSIRTHTHTHARALLALWRPGPLTHWLIRHKREARRGLSFCSSSTASRFRREEKWSIDLEFDLFVTHTHTVDYHTSRPRSSILRSRNKLLHPVESRKNSLLSLVLSRIVNIRG